MPIDLRPIIPTLISYVPEWQSAEQAAIQGRAGSHAKQQGCATVLYKGWTLVLNRFKAPASALVVHTTPPGPAVSPCIDRHNGAGFPFEIPECQEDMPIAFSCDGVRLTRLHNQLASHHFPVDQLTRL